jgi:hypothetical protein
MNILLFGAAGMIGQAVLRECLAAADVETVLSVGQKISGQQHPKLQEVLHRDLPKYSLQSFDACFFCIEVSSNGMTEAANKRTAYVFALAIARWLVPLYAQMNFVHVADAVADSTERERTAWAREGKSMESSLLSLPFKAVYLLRPVAVQPLHSAYSSAPTDGAVTPDAIGRAMLNVARSGAAKATVLESVDINAVGRAPDHG